MELNEHYKTKSIDRVLDIIEYFQPDNQESGVSEISRRLNIHKSTIHRLLACLEDRGYVKQNEETGKYKLSLKLTELGFMVLDSLKIQEEVHHLMEELALKIQKTVHLSVESNYEAMYIHKVENPNNIVRYSKIGWTMPLYCTAMGKVLLSAYSQQQMCKYLKKTTFEKFTRNTISDPEQLLQEIEIVRQRGYAQDQEEVEIGLQCIGVPIKNFDGKIVAALSVSAIAHAFDVHDTVAHLNTTAARISPYMTIFDQGRKVRP